MTPSEQTDLHNHFFPAYNKKEINYINMIGTDVSRNTAPRDDF